MSGLRVGVNGSPVVVAVGVTVAALLEQIGETGHGLAVAVNDELIVRGAWASTELADGDRVEVLAPMRGG